MPLNKEIETKHLDVVYAHKAINLFFRFSTFVAPNARSSMKLSSIIAIINSHRDSASTSKMPLLIFTSAKVFPLAVISTF